MSIEILGNDVGNSKITKVDWSYSMYGELDEGQRALLAEYVGNYNKLVEFYKNNITTELLQNGILHYKSKELKHQKTPNFIVLSYHILFFKN
jgi:hypothetical protein